MRPIVFALAVWGCTGAKDGADGSDDDIDMSGAWAGACEPAQTTSSDNLEISLDLDVIDQGGELSGSGTLDIEDEQGTNANLSGTRDGFEVEIALEGDQIADLKGTLNESIDEMTVDFDYCTSCSSPLYTTCVLSLGL
jgi:hypothetical protein